MAKGYWVGHIDVHDPERYKKYLEEAAPAYREFGAKFVVRAGNFEPVEAEGLGARHVVIEFDSMEKAKACYDSPAYQSARQHRLAASKGKLVIVEGTD